MALSSPSPTLPELGGSWTAGADLPNALGEIASTTVDGRIYVAGGIGPRALSNTTFQSYDPKTGTWRELAPMPEPRDHVGIAAIGRTIYATGGAIFSLPSVFGQLWAYDIDTNSWSTLAPMPARRWAHVMYALDGRLYVFGGVVFEAPKAAPTWAYDPATDTWSTDLPSMPTYREHLTGVVVDGHAWLIGGRDGRNLTAVEVFDPATRTWTSMPAMPTARGGLTAGLIGRRIHLTGGENLDNLSVYREHEVFDLETMTWFRAPPMPHPRHGLASSVIDGRWYVIGGGLHGGVASSAFVEIFTPAP